MTENKDELQNQVSQLIHQDIVNIVTQYSNNSNLNLDSILTIIQDVNLLNVHKVEYTHNRELDEIINILKSELKEKNAANISLLTVFDYLLKKEENLKKALYVNLFSKVHQEDFMDAFSIFAVLNPTVKDLFSDFMTYIFDDVFLDLTEERQIDYIYKAWNFSQHLFHDNDASVFAYEQLKVLFDKAIEQEKTEVAFWLYYTPLHYFNSGTDNVIEKVNEKFNIEIEKPLEAYIQNFLVPKYKVKPNKKSINKTKKIKVAFVMQRIIKHSTVNVFYSLVKSLMENPSKEYEFIIYDLSFAESGGSNLSYVEEFRSLGIKYINLHTRIFKNISPIYPLLEKCLKTREILIKDDIDILIGLHTRVEYIFLYTTRTCPSQIYWYHNSNAEYNVQGIDKRIAHGSIANGNFEFDEFNLPTVYDTSKFSIDKKEIKEIKKIKSKFPSHCFILGSIGRLIKIDNNEYLETVASIMHQNPNTIYLACGDGDVDSIKDKINRLNISDRFYFTGYIDSHKYSEVIDMFLSPFPYGGGEALQEYRNKSKLYVAMHSMSWFENLNTIDFQMAYAENNKTILKKSLYSKVDLKNIKDKNSLILENPYAKFYYYICHVLNKEDYVKVTNRMIVDEVLQNKMIQERTFIAENYRLNKEKSFIKVLND